MSPAAPVPIQTDLALFAGIVVAMFCGCLPGGIIAIYLADQAKKAARRGDSIEAQQRLRQSYLASGASVGLMMLVPCLYLAFLLALGGLSAVAS